MTQCDSYKKNNRERCEKQVIDGRNVCRQHIMYSNERLAARLVNACFKLYKQDADEAETQKMIQGTRPKPSPEVFLQKMTEMHAKSLLTSEECQQLSMKIYQKWLIIPGEEHISGQKRPRDEEDASASGSSDQSPNKRVKLSNDKREVTQAKRTTKVI